MRFIIICIIGGLLALAAAAYVAQEEPCGTDTECGCGADCLD